MAEIKNVNPIIGNTYDSVFYGKVELVSKNNTSYTVKFIDYNNEISDYKRYAFYSGYMRPKSLETKKYEIGAKFKTNQGYEIEIISKSKNKRLIKFLDAFGYEKLSDTKEIGNGNIKNPFHKSFHNKGYLGVGFKTNHKSFISWSEMIRRCYSNEYLVKYPTYATVTVCDEWLNFQNFAKWYEEKYPYHVKNINFHLDKDLLQQKFKNKIYSPDTCIFLPQQVNVFIASINKYNGYSWHKNNKKWVSSVKDFNSNKTINLGSFLTEQEARRSYFIEKKNQINKVKFYLKSINYLNEAVVEKIGECFYE